MVQTLVAVVGPADADEPVVSWAEAVGTGLARGGVAVVCGGLGGAMAAACRGAKAAGGTTLGFLPGSDPREANAWVDLVVATGMGEARNVLVVRAASALVAVGGGAGTLSEIALAVKLGRPVVALHSWEATIDGAPLPGVRTATEPAAAVAEVLELVQRDR